MSVTARAAANLTRSNSPSGTGWRFLARPVSMSIVAKTLMTGLDVRLED
ncbi:MAG: hypothetical protein KZQ97_09745 [Candidatus Thiodiazotropha sp. (ex Dulcina madagascariensis)]|nr:hypothetical protein [Candidatus Thiodiazotropha sp. (ex Dulcina madagascariensis)]